MFAYVLVAALAQRQPNAPNTGIAGPTLANLIHKYNGSIINVIGYAFSHHYIIIAQLN